MSWSPPRSLEARVASHRSHALHNAPLAVLGAAGAAGAMLATAQHAGPNAAQQEWLKLIFETSGWAFHFTRDLEG